jgi:hypothetical protein
MIFPYAMHRGLNRREKIESKTTIGMTIDTPKRHMEGGEHEQGHFT